MRAQFFRARIFSVVAFQALDRFTDGFDAISNVQARQEFFEDLICKMLGFSGRFIEVSRYHLANLSHRQRINLL